MGYFARKRESKLQLIKAQTRLLNADLRRYSIKAGAGRSHVTGGAKSPGGLAHSGMTRLFDHTTLRHNVRDAMFDSVAGRGMATRFADSIADRGLVAKLTPDYETLGISREEAEDWGRKVSKSFNAYLSSKDSDASGMNTGYQNQWLYSFSQQRDNDVYVRLYYTKDRSLISPVQIQFMDPDQIAGYCYTSTDGVTQEYNQGIKRDKKGKEVSYTFLVESEGGFKEVNIPRRGARSKRINVLHGFRKEFAGQVQGYPLYSHLLQEMEDITTLKSSHIQKAINQSSFGFYTKPSNSAPASGGPDDFASASAEVIGDFLGAGKIDDMGSSELDTLTMGIVNEMPVRQPGTLWYTGNAAGEDMRAVEQTAPADKFAEFVDSMISYLSSSSGMPIEVLKMKFGQNYSASRATLVLFWRIVNMWRAEMESDFLNPWLEMWVSEEIAAGRVKAPGWLNPRIKAAWLKTRWIGSSVPNIDPLKEANASAIRASLSHETLSDGALIFNGSDAEANRASLDKEVRELKIFPTGKWGYIEESKDDEVNKSYK